MPDTRSQFKPGPYRLSTADIEQMERDHRVDSVCAVQAWLNERGCVEEARRWYLAKTLPALREALAA